MLPAVERSWKVQSCVARCCFRDDDGVTPTHLRLGAPRRPPQVMWVRWDPNLTCDQRAPRALLW